MKASSHQSVGVSRVREGVIDFVADNVAREEPLAIEVTATGMEDVVLTETVAITMCTPGQPRELAIGFLLGEGIVREPKSVKMVFSGGPSDEEGQQHRVRVVLKPDVRVDWSRLKRNFYASSSCGVCGKSSLRALEMSGFEPLSRPAKVFPDHSISGMTQQLRVRQELFAQTGGVHGAGIFDWSGNLIMMQEDVGRHNAVDKAVGALFLQHRWPLQQHALVVSGRASFELVQKAIASRISLLVAVGAPSSLAVATADEFGICLVGFTKEQSYNVYTYPEYVGAGATTESELAA